MATLSVSNNKLQINLSLTVGELRFLTALVAESHEPLFASQDEMWQNAGSVVAQLQNLGVLDDEAFPVARAPLLNVSEDITQG